MAVNDRILIDGILDDRVSKLIPSGERDEVFEYFCFEQLLKFADLSIDDIRSGWTDGMKDGGIDGFFIFVNGHLLTDPATLQWARGMTDVVVWLISCKHHDTFKQAIVDKLVATISELLDFSKTSSDLRGAYSAQILAARDSLLTAYRTLSTRISSFTVKIAYVSRGNSENVGDDVLARGHQAEALVHDLFGNCEARFQFVGSSELILLSRRARPYNLELPFIECFAHGERYVLLARLEDYANFVCDENGDLRRYLFDSNVRDFAGLNRVNEDIVESLNNSNGPDFWWLNNGITVLVTKAIIVGKAIMMDDVQIVNGLQTTESIARHFVAGGDPQQRAVLVKVI